MPSTVITFDIETIPDVDTGRELHDLDGLNDADIARAMQHMRMQDKGHDFLPLHLQRIVSIAVAIRDRDGFRVRSIGEVDDDEATIVRRFFEGVEHYQPTLVTWNGSGFDLPVLHYRALLHRVQAPRYWDTGEKDRDMKWNNYISRYHARHTDLMDVLAAFQPRASAPLDQVAVMLGFPGKMGMHGSHVWDNFLAGQLTDIRNYCETDVLNTHLVYLRFEFMRGNLDDASLAAEFEMIRTVLKTSGKPHLEAFLSAWKSD